MNRRHVLLVLALQTLACRDAEPPMAPDAMLVDPPASTTADSEVTATFVRTRYAVTGRATVRVSDGVAQIEFSEDFTIASTPGPVLYLNTTNNPNTGRPLRIGALQRRTGRQLYTFQLPPGVNYRWIIIWCDPINVPMAEAALAPDGIGI